MRNVVSPTQLLRVEADRSPRPRSRLRGTAALLLAITALIGPACGPGECKEAKPLVSEVRAAIGTEKPSDALPAAEKLVAAIADAKDPNIKVMRIQTNELIEALKAAAKAPTDLAARDRSTDSLAAAVRAWREAADLFDKNTCK